MFRTEPNVRLGDFDTTLPSWRTLDERVSALAGREAVALPSVRVGICWALSSMGLKRHADHVLIPRFIGRCILNSLNRVAFPVESFTASTRAVIAVHQFGFRQRLELIEAACRERGVPYLEDSPFSVERTEQPGPGSLAKFIGLSKSLPLLKGGWAVSDNADLLAHLRMRRDQTSGWSWPLFGIMLALRWSTTAASHSNWMEQAYEAYYISAGDNALFRANYSGALAQFATFELAVQRRLAITQGQLGEHALVPENVRLAQFALVRCGERREQVAAVLRQRGFDAGSYHFDVERNMLAPRYEQVAMLPLNPRIPDHVFDETVAALASCLQGRGE